MTTSEALEAVEMRLLSVGLTDEEGPLSAPEVAGIISLKFGVEWADWEDYFERKDITPEQYCDGICHLIEAYKQYRTRDMFKQKFDDMAYCQRELDIVGVVA